MPSLKSTYPDIRYAVRFLSNGAMVRYKDKTIAQNLTFTDADFFRIFSFPIIKGNASNPLQELGNVVITKSTAKALFVNEDPVGKSIEMQLDNGWKPLTVSAVTDDIPDNSSIRYNMVVRFENLSYYNQVSTIWDSRFHDVFIQLNPGSDPKIFQSKLPVFVNRYLAENIKRMKRDGIQPAKDGSYLSLQLQPLSDIHTNTEIPVESSSSIKKSYLYLLTVVALLILFIACINFVNLSIGRSLTRTKEIGLRKTMGALKTHLGLQFWSEALVVCLIAFVVSVVCAYFLLPQYHLLFDMNIQRNMLMKPVVWFYIILGFLAVTLMAGGYPAWFMARFSVVDVLKGKISQHRSGLIRNGLITFQFVIAVLLISCTFISWQQIRYLRTKPLGYNMSQVISLPVGSEIDPNRALKLMKDKLSSDPSILRISGICDNLGIGEDGSNRTSIMGFDYKNREIKSNWIGVSYDFVKTLDLQLVAGRDFSPAFSTDSTAVLINEEMAKEVGENQIVGVLLPVDSARPLKVIGVLKNFNFKSLRQKINPLTLVMDKNFSINYILIKVKPTDLPASMAQVKDAWKAIAPGSDFKGSFLDQNVNRQYKKEGKMMEVFSIGAFIAVLLSCMGLLAMVILILSQRTREIGIRKVLGASVQSIVNLIAKDFILLVSMAILIAAPIAWYNMNKWLEDFAYHIQIGWWVFLFTGLLTILIALITISIQAIRAAFSNPVDSLRTE
jgi:ABC-type antimicrobial peptide transport system permease subunit